MKPFRNNFTHSFCKLDNFIIEKNILNAPKRSSLKRVVKIAPKMFLRLAPVACIRSVVDNSKSIIDDHK